MISQRLLCEGDAVGTTSMGGRTSWEAPKFSWQERMVAWTRVELAELDSSRHKPHFGRRTYNILPLYHLLG